MPNTFENPYLKCDRVKRIITDVSDIDYYLIKSTRPGAGTITTVMGTLWKQLCNELRRREICDVTKITEFEQLVANCRVVLSDDNNSDTITIERGEYDLLRADSANWQVERARRGLQHSPIGGDVSQTSGPNVGAGVTGKITGGSEHAPVVPDVQSESGKRRKGKRQDSSAT